MLTSASEKCVMNVDIRFLFYVFFCIMDVNISDIVSEKCVANVDIQFSVFCIFNSLRMFTSTSDI